VLDLVVAAVLIRLLGFHWVLLPALPAGAVPVLDLAPTWTAAALLITGGPTRRWWIIAAWTIATVAGILILLWITHER